MTHLGLFEGIGGFSLAAKWAGWQTPIMVEWSAYCQAVLKKNFPDATIFGDIREFDGRPYAGQIDIITGGFPCQPYSHAGKRAGNDDDRALWPEMLRVIREVAPAWVVGENVAGLLTMDGGRVFAGILADLENAGYRTETYLIPAVGVGAPHERYRVWVVANNSSLGWMRREDHQGVGQKVGVRPFGENRRAVTHSTGKRFGKAGQYFTGPKEWTPGANHRATPDGNGVNGEGAGRTRGRRAEFANEDLVATDACSGGCGQTLCENNLCGRQSNFDKQHWREHWYEVAARICRVDDGVSGGLDGIGNVPTKTKKGKAHRLEALGNAIVPQIAYQIFEAINHETGH